MINDFLKKFLNKGAIIDKYGLKSNFNFSEEISKIFSQKTVSVLSNKVLIKCHGDDAESFLNSQFTNDVKNMKNNSIILSGYCNPKGRLISVLYIIQLDREFYLYTTLDTAEPLLKKLNMYKMMSKVEFVVQKDILIGISAKNKNTSLINCVLNIKEAKKIDQSVLFKIDDNQIVLQTNSKELENLVDIKDSSILGYKSFDFMDIDSTIPFLNDSQIESYTPQMLSLDLLNGVSFSKGCYPGQEIVARTHYLGEAKKSLFKITFTSNKEISVNDKLETAIDKKNAGEILSLVKINNETYNSLAVLRKDTLNKNLTVNGAAVEIMEQIKKND